MLVVPGLHATWRVQRLVQLLGGAPQTFATFPPPHVWPVGQPPQDSVPPQPSGAFPHSALAWAQVFGTHVVEPKLLYTAAPQRHWSPMPVASVVSVVVDQVTAMP